MVRAFRGARLRLFRSDGPIAWADVLAHLKRRIQALPQYENNVLVLTAVFVGSLAGAGAIAMEHLLRLFGRLFLGGEGVSTGEILRVLIAPAIGGLIVGPMIARVAREAKGHGVPEVMEAVALRGGRIRPRVAIVKTLASAVTIGSGGSAGREGPIVQVGATLGSTIAQALKMSEARTRLLVASGAAGGIAAAFNAPLAGVFFALEVILQRFTARGFATVVLAAVTSSVIWRAAFGNRSVLDVPSFGLVNPVEMLLYVVLGLAAAAVAWSFVKGLYWAEDRFEGLPIPDDLKPALGGLLLGGVGVATIAAVGGPFIYGSGLPGMNLALRNDLVWWALLALLGAKLLATMLTLGSGASGGVFAPSLFMGAMLGGAFGQGVHALWPGVTALPGAYVMVGMAAVFAGAAQAPISSILILFEMTNDYRIILPLMLACIVSTVAYSLMNKHSIYTAKLARKGVELTEGRERHLLERTPVTSGMLTDFASVRLPAGVAEAREVLAERGSTHLVVLDEAGSYVGTVTLERLTDALEQEPVPVLEGLVQNRTVFVTRWESLDAAISRIAPRDLRVLPVVESRGSLSVKGIVTRDSLMNAYWKTLAERATGEDGGPKTGPIRAIASDASGSPKGEEGATR